MRARLLSTSAIKLLKAPKLDVKNITSQLPSYLQSIKSRGLVAAQELIDQLQALPEHQTHLRAIDGQISKIQTRRNAIEREIKLDKSRMPALRDELVDLKSQFQSASQDHKKIQQQVQDTCLSLPNLIHASVPATEPEIVEWIHPRETYVAESKRDHHTIMVRKKMVDFQSASTVTGNSWYYLINEGAELELALVSYATNKAKEHGFLLCIPPSIAKNEIIDACGFRPRDMNNEQQIYHLQDTDLGLTATAEISLAGLGIQKELDLSKGPKKMCGISRSYRAEAGARGKDTRGLYRVHEFTKVELFCWSVPEESDRILEELRGLQVEIINELGLSAKVLNMPANDLGAPAYKKYDIEAWMPGRGSFGEVTSSSNCTDYQSRRMNTKFKNISTGKSEYVHTLNGTAMAIPRIILALVENFHDANTDQIAIPKALQPYMGGRKFI
ncbi:LAFE_0F13366g1_1 [Lachancea fermentati]|uniref:serine--tRNA ligase n=1 Tax=Lachancea fermentati TaxID=4955 RepID=A0A1G4MFQ3_LACFM|nr:LAFE_0F13366g1_1 [Lachancea fermentati]